MDIRVELQDVSSVKKRLKVEVPADVALMELAMVANVYKKRVKVPGFRPGKAPVALVKRHFGQKIREELIQKLIPKSYDEAIRSEGLKPLGEPDLDNLAFEEGQPLVYEANFEISPQIELPEYKGLEVHVQPKSVTQADVQKELEKLQEDHALLVSIKDRPVSEGDYAVVDLQGGYWKAKEQNSFQKLIDDRDVVVNIGGEQTHLEFNQALSGMKVDEVKDFVIDYPSDYPEKKLASRKIFFTVQLKNIKEKQLPDLDDDFAKDLGKFANLKELTKNIENDLYVEQEKNRDVELKIQLVDSLVERTKFEVPDTLVEDGVDTIIRDMAYQMANQGIDPSRANADWVKVRSDSRPKAERIVRANLILAEIGQKEGLDVSNEELDNKLKEMSSTMSQPLEKIRQYFQQDSRIEGLREQIRRDKVLELLLKRAKVVKD